MAELGSDGGDGGYRTRVRALAQDTSFTSLDGSPQRTSGVIPAARSRRERRNQVSGACRYDRETAIGTKYSV